MLDMLYTEGIDGKAWATTLYTTASNLTVR